jgi:hypothetical protein
MCERVYVKYESVPVELTETHKKVIEIGLKDLWFKWNKSFFNVKKKARERENARGEKKADDAIKSAPSRVLEPFDCWRKQASANRVVCDVSESRLFVSALN